MTVISRIAFWMVLASLAAGCGFQLRGTDSRASVASAYVHATPRHGFADPLRRALVRSGVRLAEAPEADVLVVELLDERRERRSISVSDRAVAAEYEVLIGVRYAVRDSSGAQLIEDQWITRERVYRADRDNIVGSSEERALIEREIQNELIQQIIRALNAVAGARDGA
jgi:LPS-assembly lipoprotein